MNPFLGDSPELIGRDEALRRVFEKLRGGNHCSVIGPKGSGKSALLDAVQAGVPRHLSIPMGQVLHINFRSVTSLRELKEAVVFHLGGRRADQWRGLMAAKPLRLLVLDHLSGMDPGKNGQAMRRWLRGVADDGIQLLLATNERLDALFRTDDPSSISVGVRIAASSRRTTARPPG